MSAPVYSLGFFDLYLFTRGGLNVLSEWQLAHDVGRLTRMGYVILGAYGLRSTTRRSRLRSAGCTPTRGSITQPWPSYVGQFSVEC